MSCWLTCKPKPHTNYWGAKPARNVERDKRVRGELQQAGWKVEAIQEQQPA